jgi:hypothetical protein
MAYRLRPYASSPAHGSRSSGNSSARTSSRARSRLSSVVQRRSPKPTRRTDTGGRSRMSTLAALPMPRAFGRRRAPEDRRQGLRAARRNSLRTWSDLQLDRATCGRIDIGCSPDHPGSKEKQRPIVVPERVVTASKLPDGIGLIRVSMFPDILGTHGHGSPVLPRHPSRRAVSTTPVDRSTLMVVVRRTRRPSP